MLKYVQLYKKISYNRSFALNIVITIDLVERESSI